MKIKTIDTGAVTDEMRAVLNKPYFYHEDAIKDILEAAPAINFREIELGKSPEAEPDAYEYELATVIREGVYSGWKIHLSKDKPNVPEGSVRNLVPLYKHQPPLGGRP